MGIHTMSPVRSTSGNRSRASATVTRVGIAADHAGFALKQELTDLLRDAGCEPTDYGAARLVPGDDYPDYVVPLARDVAARHVERGIAICGSGVGACIAANKVAGVRAGVCGDCYSAHQGVEDDDMNVLCIAARVTGVALAREIVRTFLAARFREEAPYRRRLKKLVALEQRRQSAAPRNRTARLTGKRT